MKKMSADELKDNIRHIKEIVRELHVFSNQFELINNLETNKKIFVNVKEKELLKNVINALTKQLKILNNSIPYLVNRVGFYKKFLNEKEGKSVQKKAMTKITYKPSEKEKVSLIISDKDKKAFIENLSKSRLSIHKLKKKYAVEKPVHVIGKPFFYSKISNRFFRNFSNKLVAEGYFKNLNKNLRKINSRFVIGSYISMIFFTCFLAFFAGLFLFVLLLFLNLSVLYPFISFAEESVFLRFFKFIWIIFATPLVTGLLFYFYPSNEAKNLGAKIDQELPFVTIHMSAIASSGIEPTNIFKIILKGGEYKYTSIELKKLMNLINFHGEDIVSALRDISVSSPSMKLKELLNGLAVTITSGGDLHKFLSKHAETMLFDYKLEREKNTKVSETFMDIYISIAIAAPMVLLMIFVIIGSTGMMSNVFNLTTNVLGMLLILSVVGLNILFLVFLKLKQPVM